MGKEEETLLRAKHWNTITSNQMKKLNSFDKIEK